MARRNAIQSRFSAKLLFQFRVVWNRASNQRRLCEERLVLIHAPTARRAYVQARSKGRAAQHRYKNHAGADVLFEFVGVLDLVHLGVECEEDEVWYNLITMLRPKERASKIIPRPAKLNAVYWERPLTTRWSERERNKVPASKAKQRVAQRGR